MWTRLVSAVLLSVCVSAVLAARQSVAAAGSPFSGDVISEASPAAAGSAEPSLAVDRAGRVWMSWLEPREGGGHRFRMASRQGTSWSEPITITEGDTLIANWADVPALFVTSTDTLVATWMERGTARGAYGVRVKTSSDGGRSWTPTVTPHRDDTPTEHGFVSVFEAPGAGVGVVWLDGREMAGGHGSSEGAMGLRAALITGGRPGDEMLIDPRVCDCCPTSVARIDGGVIVAYRDRSDDDIRDMSVSRFLDGAWSAPRTVHADSWQINACPVNGPAIAASGRSVAVAWFTVAGGTPRTQIAFSTDAGESFSAPTPLDVDVTYGRVAMAMLDPSRVLVSSIERGPDGAFLVAREVRRNGRLSDVTRVAATSSDRASGFPRMAVSGRQVVFAWTESNQGRATGIQVATAKLK